MEEIWKDIKGYEGLYKVSNLGNIIGCKFKKNLKSFNNGNGYMHLVLRKENIKEILFSDEKPTVLARKFNISYRHFREIKTGRKWNLTRIRLLDLIEQKSI